MNLEELLEALYEAARKDPALQTALLESSLSKEPVCAFCAAAYEAGFPIGEMDLVFAGEEEYAARRRSTNGGGENSPALSGAEDYHELFLSRILSLRPFRGRIGVIDSGAGGVSVLREILRILPEEKFVYFGDTAYNPYGDREDSEIRARVLFIAGQLIRAGIKMLVVACNTATSAAIDDLREHWPDLPVIGTEPALRPAARELPDGAKILVMATAATLKLEKYRHLSGELSAKAEFIPLPCPGLAERIEKGRLSDPDLREMLDAYISPYRGRIDGIVSGCTHYPLIRDQIVEEAGGNVPLFDGAEGVARECAHRLAECAAGEAEGGEQILWLTSAGEEAVALYRKMLAGTEAP